MAALVSTKLINCWPNLMSKLANPNRLNPQLLSPVDPRIEKYMLSLTKATDLPVLSAMEKFAHENNFPIVDRLVGIFLEFLSKTISAQRIFEFGSGYGYSAFWFARGLSANGQLFCTDGDADNLNQAKYFLQATEHWRKIHFQTGLAQDIFHNTEGTFDICYNDADKGDYPEIWTIARKRINPGGFYIADNVLWHGRVVLENAVDIMPGWTEAILEHNQMIYEDPAFDTFINPTRDGVIVARKK
jgi:predicted O-methyltransferase YrrM